MATQEPKRGWWANWRTAAQEEPLSDRLLAIRLERVERDVRIYRGLFVLMVLGLAGLGSLHLFKSADKAKDVIRAHRVEVLSADNRQAVVLDADRDGGRIALRYSGNAGDPPPPAIFLTAEPTGGAIQLFEPGQNYYAASLAIGRDGQGVARLRRRGRQPGLELRGPASPSSGGELKLFNAQGQAAVQMHTDAQGRGVVVSSPKR